MRTQLAALLIAASLWPAAAPAADEVTITLTGSTAVFRNGDEILGAYRFGPDLPKPYLIAVSAPDSLELLTSELDQPVADEFAPGNQVFVAVEQAELKKADGSPAEKSLAFGEIVKVDAAKDGRLHIVDGELWIQSRDIVPVKAMVTRIVNLNPPKEIKDRKDPRYYDHPHHKGVWNSVDEVNDIKFWAEEGVIRNAVCRVEIARGNPAVLVVVNHWLDRDGTPLLEEQTTLSAYADRLFSYDIRFQAVKPAHFGDTKEGMFAIRLPNSMREQFADGPVVNAEGRTGTKGCWGRTSKWVDYVGPVGDHLFGVTVMDDPRNPRKSRYHVRDYGLFAINPFGQGSYTKGTDDVQPAEPLELKAGESVRFRYGLYIHRGDAEQGRVREAYERFAAGPRGE